MSMRVRVCLRELYLHVGEHQYVYVHVHVCVHVGVYTHVFRFVYIRVLHMYMRINSTYRSVQVSASLYFEVYTYIHKICTSVRCFIHMCADMGKSKNIAIAYNPK